MESVHSLMFAGWLGVLSAVPAAQNAGSAVLRESLDPGGATHVVIELKASGELQAETLEKGQSPKPVPIRVQSRFDYYERVLEAGPDGLPRKTVRQTRQAAVAMNGSGRPTLTQIRPEVAMLLAEWRDGRSFTFSPGGPLTRQELDIVEGPVDSLLPARLLPKKAVAVGDTWDIDVEAAKTLGDYNALATSTLKAKLVALDDVRAEIRLAGEIRGAARGGEGTTTLDGSFTFDRASRLVSRLEVTRSEVRRPGQVEPGFDFRGTLTLERKPVEVPARLTDAALAGLPLAAPEPALLRFIAPDGSYTLLHDRDWHLFWDDTRLAILKRLDHGEFVAQCNLTVGPNAGKGRHQDPAQFQADIKSALGGRFVAVLGESEVSEPGDPIYRYRIVVQGREGQRDVVWYYYLIANPDGEQILATFTLNADDMKRMGNQDLQLVGSLEWRDVPPDAK